MPIAIGFVPRTGFTPPYGASFATELLVATPIIFFRAARSTKYAPAPKWLLFLTAARPIPASDAASIACCIATCPT
jgi:hypothetical protein